MDTYDESDEVSKFVLMQTPLAVCMDENRHYLIEVGEQSGRLPEMMAKLAEGYQDRAKAAATTLTVVSTIAVWAAVAIVLILLILRIFSVYLGVLQDATQI